VASIVGESKEAVIGNHLFQRYFFGRDKEHRVEKISLTAMEIYSALDSSEQISRSLARLRVTESSIGRILTAICDRPIADAPVTLSKRKSHGRLLYDVVCNEEEAQTESSLGSLLTKLRGGAKR
jgi:hypothetical protein